MSKGASEFLFIGYPCFQGQRFSEKTEYNSNQFGLATKMRKITISQGCLFLPTQETSQFVNQSGDVVVGQSLYMQSKTKWRKTGPHL